MPLWRIFYNPSALQVDQRQSLAKAVTKLYTEPPVGLPAFYVNVLFIPLQENEYFIGGEPRINFVRIVIEQIARTLPEHDTEAGRQARAAWNDKIAETVKPYIQDRGLDWEHHIFETPFDLWRVNGISAPPQNSDGEELWNRLNRAVPWKNP